MAALTDLYETVSRSDESQLVLALDGVGRKRQRIGVFAGPGLPFAGFRTIDIYGGRAAERHRIGGLG